jgi:secreted PhoX family phosphatase
MVSRRNFLLAAGGLSQLPWFFESKAHANTPANKSQWQSLPFTNTDDLTVPKGFSWDIIAKEGDIINNAKATFGDCADYVAFLPGKDKNSGFLWVNHEYVNARVHYGKQLAVADKTKAMIDREMAMVGGSYIEIKRSPGTQKWTLESASPNAFRIDAHTSIPMVGPAGGRTAMGTLANCSGGLTPWSTVLTCEENFEYGWDPKDSEYAGWADHYKVNIEDYGWVVEVNPTTKKARKLTALGRFAHEGAWVHTTKDKRLVVYMGDDARFQHLYKYVSTGTLSGNPEKDGELLNDGILYAANMKALRWEELSLRNPVLKNDPRFKTNADILTNCRLAALAAGATPLNRPEGIVLDPLDGRIYLALTNNDKAGDFFGSVMVVTEKDGNHAGTEFDFATHVSGTTASGMICPDNLAAGPGHSLWVSTDISGWSIGKGVYRDVKRNGLYHLTKDKSGVVYPKCFALGPFQSELTSPCFHQNEKELFVCVQHPGEYSFEGSGGLTSHWPSKDGNPKSAVVVVTADKGSNF